MTGAQRTLLLTNSDIAAVAGVADYYDAAAEAFRAFAEGRICSPAPMEIKAADGAFHIKGASMEIGGRRFAAIKINGNFPLNPGRTGLPTIQGALLLNDAGSGSLLAIMDSAEVTRRRTAAASALAVNLLARRSAETLLICGCGVQARAHLQAIVPLRAFRRVLAFDAAPDRQQQFSADAKSLLGFEVSPVADLEAAAFTSDVIVTLTTTASPLPLSSAIRPGAFIAAVGADSPFKNEIPSEVMDRSVVITDVTDQCAVMGDLRAAIEAGAMTRSNVRAELGQALTGAAPGRLSDDEVVIFDSTGAAFQDLTVAAMIYERASAKGIGATINLQH